MLKINRVAVVLGLLLFVNVSLIAQNSTNSPYTRYGFGSIADRSFGAGRSMGGIGYGLRSSRQINPMNPASYSSMDSLTFLFDAGATIHRSWYDDGLYSQKDINGNFEYAAMQFPLTSQLAMSVGVLPYSHVGYDFYKQTTTSDNLTYAERFKGTGGLNEVYVGLSIDIWKKRLALGANVSYLFGSVNRETQLTSISVYTKNKVNVHNLKYDFGIQYTHPLSKTERLTLGVVYSPKIKLKATAYDLVSSSSDFSSLISGDTVRNHGYDIPNVYGVGLSYTKDNKMILAADVSFQEWSKAQFEGTSKNYKNMLKVALGGEYIPNNFTRSYMKRVRYRAGLHYDNSYLKIDGSSYNEYGATVGMGFPLMDNRSFINASVEYVNVSPESSTLIKEQYLRLTISYTFNEYWFFKRKVD
ncbi:MAG: hypothetical protein LBV72_12780 [Tannerella sp.]|jgi:hypothetical protein|nr:hypothetical protein [Tannerella sp.]